MPTRDQSPLAAIRQKELEAEARLASAKHRAELEVLAARRQASARVEQAERDAQEEADKIYRAELELVDTEAKNMIQEAEKAGDLVATRSAELLNQAVERILEIVKPSV